MIYLKGMDTVNKYSQHLCDTIPFFLQEENRIVNEIKKKLVSVIFDGTTHICEVMAIVVRYIDTYWIDWLVRLLLLSKSLTGEVAQTISTLLTEYSISSDFLTAAMRDHASINGVAMRSNHIVSIVYPNAC